MSCTSECLRGSWVSGVYTVLELLAAKLLLVGELAAEPCLRQVVRNELYQ